MSTPTIDSYDRNAAEVAKRHSQVEPTRLYQLAETFLKKGLKTLDLGCGIGRDTAWLSKNQFPAIGADPSESLLKFARESHKALEFKSETLPNLTFENGSFDNIYSCAVLMHIQHSNLISSVVSILRVMKPSGRLVLCWRDGEDENDGREFYNYHLGQVAQLFESLGGKVLHQEFDGRWKYLAIEKVDLNQRQGISQIQDIITRDKKTATYKFALLRALSEISRYESHVVTWYREGDLVLVPLKRIATRWVYYYWPLVQKDIRQTTNKNLAFATNLKSLDYKLSEFALLKRDLEQGQNKELNKLITKVADTIHKGPITYSGGGSSPVFKFMEPLDAEVYGQLKDKELGMVGVPISIWRDLTLFSHWIEDSLAIQWAERTEKLNKDEKFAIYLDLITKSVQEDIRSTNDIRNLFKGKKVKCVWSGKMIETFAVDHMIPWSVWRNNDLWNLLPSQTTLNTKKSDLLPSPAIVKKRFDNIRGYWETYAEAFPNLFEKQLDRSLGVGLKDALTTAGAEALEQALIRINYIHGGSFWEPK